MTRCDDPPLTWHEVGEYVNDLYDAAVSRDLENSEPFALWKLRLGFQGEAKVQDQLPHRIPDEKFQMITLLFL
jgi:hypothetical protein